MHRMQCPPGALAGSSAPQSEHILTADICSIMDQRKLWRIVTENSTSPSHHSKQIPDFFIDLFRAPYRMGDLATQQFSQAATQPMQRHPHCSFIHSEQFGGFLVKPRADPAGQTRL